MKKIIFALAAIAITFMACETVQTPILLDISKVAFTESGNSTATKTMTATVTNTTSTAGTISWDFAETSAVSGWTYTITVNGTAATGTSGSFEIAGDAAVTVEVMVNPNGTAGVGGATLTFKESSRPLGAIAYGYTATTTPAAPQFSLSKTTDSGTMGASQTIEYTTVVTNLTANDLEVTWARSAASSNPAAWVYATCENLFCHAPFVTSKAYTIPANGSFDLKANIRANNETGTGEVTHVVYLASDSAATSQSYVVTHTAN